MYMNNHFLKCIFNLATPELDSYVAIWQITNYLFIYLIDDVNTF